MINRQRLWVLAFVAMAVSACGSGFIVQMSGAADDGETFKGTLDDTEAYATAGPVHMTSNRGATCMGHFRYEGLIGPAGKMNFICSDGRVGEATMNGVWSGTVQGTIAGKPFTMKLGGG